MSSTDCPYNWVISELCKDASRSDITVDPSKSAVIITVKRNLWLRMEKSTNARAMMVIRQGARALCNSAPSQIAAPTAMAR
jgi:hypothetical protein